MGTDYAEKERAFIAGLGEDTGRDLNGWMQAIAAEKLDNRNDIIDWLRQQGFPFARASWLERIHHNGGRLIYADDEVAVAVPQAAVVNAPKAPVFPFSGKPPERKAEASSDSARLPKLAIVSTVDAASNTAPGISELFSAAKGLRPLADVLASEIRRNVPSVDLKAEPPLVLFAAPLTFAALLPSAKDLKLYADFGGAGGRVKRADVAKTFTPPFPHLVALNDVRQIDAEFLSLITTANSRING